MSIFKKWFGGNKGENVDIILPEAKKNLPDQINTECLTTSEMIKALTDEKLANCINHPNLKSDNPKKYFVVKDLNSYYKTLNWDDGNNFLVNEFTLNLQWQLEDRVK